MCVLFSLKAIWFIFDFQQLKDLSEYWAWLIAPFATIPGGGVLDHGSLRSLGKGFPALRSPNGFNKLGR